MSNKLYVSSSPHFNLKCNTTMIMGTVLFALLPEIIMGIVLFRWAALIRILVSVASCVIFEFCFQKMTKQKVVIVYLSACVTVVMMALVSQPTAPVLIFVVCAAVAHFLAASLITGQWDEWLRRSLTFLVISCPCALVISVPLSYFNGIGRASKMGILVKGSDVLEHLSRTGIVALDKTGTVTKGVFEVVAVHPHEISEEQLLLYAAGAEKYSTHPIADAIRESVHDIENLDVKDAREIAGHGVTATVNGHFVAAGNSRLMDSYNTEAHECHYTGTIVHVCVDGIYAGHIVIADVVKESAEKAVADLKDLGVHEIVMLTGDRKITADDIGKRIGVNAVYAELKPDEKVEHLQNLMRKKNGNETVVFVGDGINDAPVLAVSDLGVAMGNAGSDAAVEAANIVLIDDDPQKLHAGIRLAIRTQKIVKENIAFSILIKAAVMILGAAGVVPLWLAVFSDVGVCLLAILNAMR